MYVKQKCLANGVVSYECELRRNDQQCKAILKVAGNHIVDRINEHTHAPNAGHAEASKVKAAIKRRALSGEDTAQQILSQDLSDINEDTDVNLQAIRDMLTNIRR